MTDIDSILHRIRTGLAKHGRKKLISDETGIHVVRLCQVQKPGSNPTADTIRKLDAAIIKLFPGDLPEPPHQPE
jgi:hypothetical protein